MNKKKELRAYYKGLRISLSDIERGRLDKAVCENFLRLYEYKVTQIILCYVSSDIEVGTTDIILTALKDGKAVYVPKCADEGNVMTFHRIFSLDDLSSGAYGILEPDASLPVYNGEKAVCVVPALAYDKTGHRLGFGKGYYDRFLVENKNVYPIGLSYDFCVVDEIPSEIHDIAVKKIISENIILDIEV